MKKSIKRGNITRIALILILFIIFALVFIRLFQRETSLVDLQKAILIAETEEERQKILERLDNYYLTMSIPDSILRRVQAEVDTLRKHFSPDTLAMQNTPLDSNIYQVEIDLKGILRQAMLARVRGDEPTFQAIMRYAKILADSVDMGTNNNYWRPWVAKVKTFDADKARTWLMAERAKRLCDQYHLKVIAHQDAEGYGALGLQLLQQVGDAHFRLDIVQRLQTILYRSLGMYDLSFALAQREISEAKALKYHIRTNGLTYNYATALLLAGRNDLAQEAFLTTIQRTERYRKVPNMDWYGIRGRLGMAQVCWQMADYGKALAICHELEESKLGDKEKVLLHSTKGIIQVNLGNYDLAEDEYRKSLNLAESVGDLDKQILALANLGTLCFRLAEYDKANLYFDKAITLLTEYNLPNIGVRGAILVSKAEVKAAENKIDDFNKIIQQANRLIELIDLPTVKAELLRSLGRVNMKVQRYQLAHDYFLQALALYKDCGLLRAAAETEIDLIQSLIGFSDYRQAKQMLDELYESATKNHDEQREIDAFGLMAEIAHKEGHIDKAIRISTQLINRVENLSARFTNNDNLISFRQRNHHYLTNAVAYELEWGRIDSAFVKLDYIKARAEKNTLNIGKSIGNNASPCFIDIETFKARLNQKALVISYFVNEDTLYAFVIHRKNLRLLKRPIRTDELRKISNTYMHSICMTIDVLRNDQPAAFATHYDSVAAVSQRLYQILLGWPELQVCLQNTAITYIVPDDILYGIPFSCLMVSNEKEARFLVHQTAIVNLPSAIFLQAGRSTTTNRDFRLKRVLISVNPRFPKAENLVNFIKKRFPLAEEVIMDKPAITKEDILSELNKGYDIYIFLGHSAANTRFPEASFFELTARRQADLSPLTIELSLTDLRNIDWSKAETVFLIGCETASGKVYRGTGLAGIQQGLLTLGAREVLASLWKIDANQANSQMIDFLNSWTQKRQSAQALQDMQIRAISTLEKDSYYKKPHPYLWGSFAVSQIASY